MAALALDVEATTAGPPALVKLAPAPTVRVPFRVELVAFTTAALMTLALVLPLASRFIIVLAVLRLVGA
jgi:hypothetical protein